jgi:DNA-binding transcriptional LysR family regulator
MHLQTLRYFIAAFEEGSVSKAALRCHVAQPSVTHAIRQLEAELDAVLFVRSVKGMTPTPAAFALVPKARRILEDVASLSQTFREEGAAPASVRVYCHPTIALRKLVPIFDAIRAMGEVDLRLEPDQCGSDLAIGPSSGDTKEVRLWSERYDLLVPASDPLAHRTHIYLSDLVGVRMIARCKCERPHILPRERIRPEIVALAHDEESAIALVSAGLGVSVSPGVETTDPTVVVRQLEDFVVHRMVVATGAPGLVELARLAVAGDVPP